MSFDKEEIKSYISSTKLFTLATIEGENGGIYPSLRVIGAFAVDGFTIYFSTGKDSAKAKQIENNPNVTAFFQQEGQELPHFRNVSVFGKASFLKCEEGVNKAIELISDRNPRFKERIKNNGRDKVAIFKIKPEIIKSLDYGRGHGPQAVEKIKIDSDCCSKVK